VDGLPSGAGLPPARLHDLARSHLKFEPDAEIGKKEGFRSGNSYIPFCVQDDPKAARTSHYPTVFYRYFIEQSHLSSFFELDTHAKTWNKSSLK
jgi:hypothetical protein